MLRVFAKIGCEVDMEFPGVRAALFARRVRSRKALPERKILTLAFLCLFGPGFAGSNVDLPSAGIETYRSLRLFELGGGSAGVENLTLVRDRLEMTFSGTFYFESPVAGEVRGAVFVGKGTFRATVPDSEFERQHVRRLLGADLVESDFQTAVLRFTDDSFQEVISVNPAAPKPVPPQVLKLASEFEPRFLKETGVNLSARMALGILNAEAPGIFVGQFDRGRRGRFTSLLDFQGRVLASTFDVNSGEKGVIFAYRGASGGNDLWMAFYGLADYRSGKVDYPSAFDLVAIDHYRLDVDVREPKRNLKVVAVLDAEVLRDHSRVVSFQLSESLPEYDSMRLKRSMRLKSARMADGSPLDAVQEDWEGGLTVFLPGPARRRGEKFSIQLELEGDNLYSSGLIADCYYPLNGGEWYPRHGYLNRSTFDLTFRHRKQYRVAASGVRLAEEETSEGQMVTRWTVAEPLALITFGVGRLERHANTVPHGEGELPVEFYSLPGYLMRIKEDFILAELGNCVQYFAALFGPYPYGKFGAMFHPRRYGQGFGSMLLLPKSDRASKYTYSFIAHETAHQWWGGIVSWRSYKDQWLSEGFAEYSGILYTGFRDGAKSQRELIEELRRSLKDPPRTETGVAKGRLADVGPLILGHRLSTRETQGAYTALIYSKGALVLRMIHFLLTDHGSGSDKAFFEMMADFVKRHGHNSASTDDFREVVNEHFARSYLAQTYRLPDLNWFFYQWVYQAYLPSYRLEYRLDEQPDGSVLVTGHVHQDGVPEHWLTVLPVTIQFGRDHTAMAALVAKGPTTPVSVRLHQRPSKIELDPSLWILSDKTTTKAGR